ncbi:hypothetical protein AB0M43_13055 [Longispora sp. NPDC051575]|uniref:hypothetical protein n=1 Tax=Longispora sp. NPDC051575 TaxID=3154943 RepID=UPI0034396367
MSRRRWIAMAVVLGLVFTGPPAEAQSPPTWDFDQLTDSAVVAHGRKGAHDDYTALEVTVAQTRGLTNQGLSVTWKGGKPTSPDGFGANYLQLMQCWGPDPTAADFRQTCQFGAGKTAAGNQPGAATAHRDLVTGIDPRERTDAKAVPFRSQLTGEVTPDGGAANPFPNRPGTSIPVDSTDLVAPYFDLYSSNEVPYALTSGDGTGRVIFETQTAVQAPHLGCGKPRTTGGPVEPCWLVVVPRGEHDADGTYQDGSGAKVDGSPLSATFFADAIVIRLDFAPVSGLCPIGRSERRTVGTEMVSDAITSWQPALCQGGGAVYGYSQTGDSDARRQVQLTGPGAPGLAFTADPVLPAEDAPPILHAPVALSSVVIAFNIDTQLDIATPEQGTALRELKLTPRLVAKLLTHSYKRDVPGGSQGGTPEVPITHVKDNQVNLRQDPEFLELNPKFAPFVRKAAPDGLMVALGDAAAAREVWRWILADPEAKAWLDGQPDATKMVVNKYFANELKGGAPENYPNPDPSCYRATPDVPVPGFCMQDYRPYLGSMHQTATQTLRADAKAKNGEWDPNKIPPAFKANPPQSPGVRFAMSITDSASASRFGLYPASLRNRNGEFVPPTSEAMLAGYGAMVPSPVAGVLAVDPQRKAAGAYPLTMLTYAAADTTEDAAARKDYAALVRYAAGPGQVAGRTRGQLPAGYVPLPEPLRKQALEMADKLEKWVNAGEPTAPAETPPGTSGGSTAGGGTPNRGATPPAAVVPAPSLGAKTPVPAASVTKGVPVGVLRFVWFAVLGVGLFGALSGPTLLRWENRRRRGQ